MGIDAGHTMHNSGIGSYISEFQNYSSRLKKNMTLILEIGKQIQEQIQAYAPS